jgi:hypothetical protein
MRQTLAFCAIGVALVPLSVWCYRRMFPSVVKETLPPARGGATTVPESKVPTVMVVDLAPSPSIDTELLHGVEDLKSADHEVDSVTDFVIADEIAGSAHTDPNVRMLRKNTGFTCSFFLWFWIQQDPKELVAVYKESKTCDCKPCDCKGVTQAESEVPAPYLQ